jgi:hypothetical protein
VVLDTKHSRLGIDIGIVDVRITIVGIADVAIADYSLRMALNGQPATTLIFFYSISRGDEGKPVKYSLNESFPITLTRSRIYDEFIPSNAILNLSTDLSYWSDHHYNP